MPTGCAVRDGSVTSSITIFSTRSLAQGVVVIEHAMALEELQDQR